MKVSIIVTVYNLEDYIEECLHSLSEQCYKDIEVIIINDGSTDGSKEKVETFIKLDERFKLYNLSNGGVARARNFALEVMTGNYIMFVDGDDYITFDCVTQCMNNIGDADILCFNHNILKNGVFKKNKRFNFNKYKKDNIFSLAIESIDLEPNPWGKLYKKNVFENIKYPNGLKFEDFAIFYKLFINSVVFFLDKPLYIYRLREGSIMRSFKYNTIHDKKIILESMRQDINKYWSAQIASAYYNSYIYHMLFVTSNIIINNSDSPYHDLKYLISMVDKKICSYWNLITSKSLGIKEKLFLILLRVSPKIVIKLKKTLRG